MLQGYIPLILFSLAFNNLSISSIGKTFLERRYTLKVSFFLFNTTFSISTSSKKDVSQIKLILLKNE